jgi:hypothetical protein
MLKEWSLTVAAFGACGALLLEPIDVSAQARVPPVHAQKTSGSARPQSDPRALQILKAVSDRLAAARTLSFAVADTAQWQSREGTPLSASKTFDITLQRPNKLRVSVSTDGSSSGYFYCNGSTLMTYSGPAKSVVIAKAPATINDCLSNASRASSISFPFPLLIVADPFGLINRGLKRADYGGHLQLADGTDTDSVTYSSDNMSVQMLVGTEDRLPRVVHVTSLGPTQLRHDLVLSKWRIDAPVGADVFTSLSITRDAHGGEPGAVGTSGVLAARRSGALSINTYAPKYWGSGGVGGVGAYPNYFGNYYDNYPGAAYYSSPDGYGYYPQSDSGAQYPSAPAGYAAEPCYDCDTGWTTTGGPIPGAPAGSDVDEGTANFNIALTSGWYNASPPTDYDFMAPTNTPSQPTFVPGQVVTKLPVGCAAPYTRGAAFYLCGNTWFSGVLGPDGRLYFRVITVPAGYGY